MDADGITRAGLPRLYGCPILTRLKAFVVTQGEAATLEQVVRDDRGVPVDLGALLPAGGDSSGSSASAAAEGSALLRVREWAAGGDGPAPRVWQETATSPDPAAGLLRARLDPGVYGRAGLYELSWAVRTPEATIARISTAILSVERSLFPTDVNDLRRNVGPPTLSEIRLMVADSAPVENLLLEDVEFGDEQLLLALVKPVEYWNELPPPLRTRYSTRNFPFRGAWSRAVAAQLHYMAAAHYRRNRLSHSAGGVTVDDQNKEREYLAEAQRGWDEYKEWVATKKVALNMREFSGSAVSSYYGRAGW